MMSQAAVRSRNVRMDLFYTSLSSETMACVYTKEELNPRRMSLSFIVISKLLYDNNAVGAVNGEDVL